ncbi:hypothetical protein [Methylomagnum ishizawai]|uniref:hypothetical protein n=1 Tax=Methylomagnum ishizawai TaxID=1760988 RepID=UPI001C334B43|nr:hypothetical protein [Methylomagnum ishizawai]BBL75969.1 hypothetical protein MishRS11D_30670 [Methylomagnum ishizawai]
MKRTERTEKVDQQGVVKAREAAELPSVCVHDLRHTFARLIECVERLCATEGERKPEMALVRRRK